MLTSVEKSPMEISRNVARNGAGIHIRGDGRWSRSIRTSKGPSRVSNCEVHHNWGLEHGGGVSVADTTAVVSNTRTSDNVVYDCLGRMYVSFRKPECLLATGANAGKEFSSKKECEKQDDPLVESGRTWLWAEPTLIPTSAAKTAREMLQFSLMDGFLTLKDPSEETTPMVPGWRVKGSVWDHAYDTTWFLHPLDNGDPLLEDSSGGGGSGAGAGGGDSGSGGRSYKANNLADYLHRIVIASYGVYGDRVPIAELHRDLMRGDGEATGVESFVTSCSATGGGGWECTGGPFEWRMEPHTIGQTPSTRQSKPHAYDRYLIDPIFGNGGGLQVVNSDVGHDVLVVENNAAGVGGGVNVRNSRVVAVEHLEYKATSSLVKTTGIAEDVPKMYVQGNVAYRAYPFGRNILDKDSNMRPPHSGGQGGGISLNMWYNRFEQCLSDGTIECIPSKMGMIGQSAVEDAVLEHNVAHTMGGSFSLGSEANLTRVASTRSRALFGGSVGVQDGSRIFLNRATFDTADASVYMRGEGMTDDTTCSGEGGFGGLMYIAEGAHVFHESVSLSDGKASRAGGGVAYGPSELCEIYANKTGIRARRRSLLIGRGSRMKSCSVNVGLENLGRANNTIVMVKPITDAATDVSSGSSSSNRSMTSATTAGGERESEERESEKEAEAAGAGPEFISPLVGGGMFSDGMDFRATGWVVERCSATKGGGVYIKMPSDSSLSNVELYQNEAFTRGGGLEIEEGAKVAIDTSIFNENRAGQMGGAICIIAQTSKETVLSIDATTIEHNEAPSGGALYLSFSPQLSLNIQRSKFDSNTASSIGGGAICALGGPSCADLPCEFKVDETTFVDNRAPVGSGGAVLLDRSDADIQRSWFLGSSMLETNRAGKKCVDSRANEKVGNTNLDEEGNSEFYCSKRDANAIQGGGIASRTVQSTVKLDSVRFEGLLAHFGGGLYCTKASTCLMKNTTFASNEAKFGGGIQGVQSAKLTTTSGFILHNYASVDGGGIHMEKAQHVMDATAIRKNMAGKSGGGLYVDKRSILHSTANKVVDNMAEAHGGGLYVGQASSLVDLNTLYEKNVAVSAGGAIFVTDAQCAVFTNSPALYKSRTEGDCRKVRHLRRVGPVELVKVKEKKLPSKPTKSAPIKAIKYARFGEKCGQDIAECGDYVGNGGNTTVGMVCINTNEEIAEGYCSLHPCRSSKSTSADRDRLPCPSSQYSCVVPIGSSGGYCFRMNRRLSSSSSSGGQPLLPFPTLRRVLTGMSVKFGESNALTVETTSQALQQHTMCLFRRNKVLAHNSAGGAVCVERKGNFELVGCTFEDNDAVDQGGGLIVRGRGIADVTNVMFRNNRARTGAGIGLKDESQMDMKSAFLYRNVATEEGGGLRISGKVAYVADDVGYAENQAGTDGGSISVNRMESVDSLCMQADERSLDDPRPFNDCRINVRNSHHRKNTAWKRGGSVYTAHLLCKYRTLQSTIDGMITDAIIGEKSSVKLNLDRYQAPPIKAKDDSRGLKIDSAWRERHENEFVKYINPLFWTSYAKKKSGDFKQAVKEAKEKCVWNIVFFFSLFFFFFFFFFSSSFFRLRNLFVCFLLFYSTSPLTLIEKSHILLAS